MSIGVITNDIYTKEDEKILVNTGVLPEDRIIGVETGGCPHTAIREDASMNFAAIDELLERNDDIELIFIESGGDNLRLLLVQNSLTFQFISLMLLRAKRFHVKVDKV